MTEATAYRIPTVPADLVAEIARPLKMTDAVLEAESAYIQAERPLLDTLLKFSTQTTERSAGFDVAMSSVNGSMVASRLLRTISQQTGMILPPESSVQGASLANTYGGSSEAVYHKNQRLLGAAICAADDIISRVTMIREFEAGQPAFYREAIRLGARSVVRPPSFFSEFLASGNLQHIDPRALPFNTSPKTSIDTSVYDKFMMFTEGFGTIVRLMAGAQELDDLKHRFGEG